MFKRNFLFSIVFFFWLSSLTLAKEKFIIDTDAGDDDWLAITYMLCAPNIDIKLISVVGTGDTHISSGIKNVLYLIGLNWPWNIPVTGASNRPIKYNNQLPPSFRKSADNMHNLRKNDFTYGRVFPNGIKTINSILKKSKDKINILAIGPLTNIAKLIKLYPDSLEKIKMIYIMGGAVDVKGNADYFFPGVKEIEFSECNFFCDPEAAKIVINSNIPITLIPLDITNKIPLTLEIYNKFQNNNKTPNSDFALSVFNIIKPQIEKKDYFFWDPLAAIIAVNPQKAKYKYENLTINEKTGQIIKGSKNGFKIRIAEDINFKYVEDSFLKTLNQGNN